VLSLCAFDCSSTGTGSIAQWSALRRLISSCAGASRGEPGDRASRMAPRSSFRWARATQTRALVRYGSLPDDGPRRPRASASSTLASRHVPHGRRPHRAGVRAGQHALEARDRFEKAHCLKGAIPATDFHLIDDTGIEHLSHRRSDGHGRSLTRRHQSGEGIRRILHRDSGRDCTPSVWRPHHRRDEAGVSGAPHPDRTSTRARTRATRLL